MAIEARELELYHPASRWAPAGREFRRLVRRLHRDRKLPDRFPLNSSEIPTFSLEVSRDLQVDRFIELGFHTILGQDEDEYRKAFILPEGLAQPTEYRGVFDIFLIIDPRIPLAEQHKKAGVEEWIDSASITDYVDVPMAPYGIWTHNGRRHVKHRSVGTRKTLEGFRVDEEQSPQIEVTGLFLQYEGLFYEHGIEGAGSLIENDAIPLIKYVPGKYGGTRLVSIKIGSHRITSAPLSRGDQLVELGAS